MNFAVDVVEARRSGRRSRWSSSARDGARREGRFGAVAERGAATGRRSSHAPACGAATSCMTLVGNRPDWVVAMVACFRQGYVVLPCTEQLRAKDLRAAPGRRAAGAVVADGRNARGAASGRLGRPDDLGAGRHGPAGADARRAPPPADLQPLRPVPDHVHQRDRGRAEGRPARPALPRRASGCRPSTGSAARPGDLVWCTAASGWSKSARNVFIAPWLRGAAALLHDARFDPAERLDILERERVERALHGADRVPRDRQARARCAASRGCARWSPPARRSTPRCCTPGATRPAWRSATATARPRPAS